MAEDIETFNIIWNNKNKNRISHHQCPTTDVIQWVIHSLFSQTKISYRPESLGISLNLPPFYGVLSQWLWIKIFCTCIPVEWNPMITETMFGSLGIYRLCPEPNTRPHSQKTSKFSCTKRVKPWVTHIRSE